MTMPALHLLGRAIAIAALAAMLAGCNLVYSEKPLFTKADSVGAAPFKPGLWARVDKGCEVDVTKPVAQWPECAGAMVITPTSLIDPAKPGESADYVLVAGDPPILQAPYKNDAGLTLYFYIGIKPLALDSKGRMVGFESWISQCGPPPPKSDKPISDKTPMSEFVTKEPIPGLIPNSKTGMCKAIAQDPVRASAKASRAWSDEIKPVKWVADAPPPAAAAPPSP